MDLIVVGCGWAGERHVKAIRALDALPGAEAVVLAMPHVAHAAGTEQAAAAGRAPFTGARS